MSGAARIVSVGERPMPEVVGYVEVLTDNAALGWTWHPGRSDRLAVELRLHDETVARATANGMREDLARSGIGDGRHAFTLPIPDAFRSRSAELRVVVVGEDGATTVLEAPPVPNAKTDDLAQLQRGIEMLIGSQRLMHRNLQAALLQQPAATNALSEIATVQASLQETLATVELFAVRLEQALTSREAPPARKTASAAIMAVTAMAAVALVGSCWALWRTMAG